LHVNQSTGGWFNTEDNTALTA